MATSWGCGNAMFAWAASLHVLERFRVFPYHFSHLYSYPQFSKRHNFGISWRSKLRKLWSQVFASKPGAKRALKTTTYLPSSACKREACQRLCCQISAPECRGIMWVLLLLLCPFMRPNKKGKFPRTKKKKANRGISTHKTSWVCLAVLGPFKRVSVTTLQFLTSITPHWRLFPVHLL